MKVKKKTQYCAPLLATLALTLPSLPIIAASSQSLLNVAIVSDIRGTNPGVTRDGNTDTVHMHLVEGLMGYAKDFTLQPVLAESMTLSADGTQYTFTLRQGVNFHNGANMTSEHVKWSWDRYMNKETKWRCRSYFTGEKGSKVTSVTTPDKYTVVFTLDKPSTIFLANMARFDCGSTAVLHPDSVDKDGKWLAPIATGPFVLGEHKPGRYLDLLKFKDYSLRSDPQNGYAGAKKVSIDKVRIHILSEATVSKAAYMAGDIDLLLIAPSDVTEIEKTQHTNIFSSATATWDTLLINAQDPLLKDPLLRQAIAHAINKDEVIAVISEGRRSAHPSTIPPVSNYFSEAVKQGREFDLDKAKALLKQSNYQGEELRILTSKRRGAYYERALIIQSMLKKAGIKAKLEVLEWGAQLAAYKSGNFQLQSFSYSARLDPALSFEMITGTNPRKVWKDKDAIDLVEQLSTESVTVERQKLVNQLHAMFIERTPAIGLGHRTAYFAVRDDIQGFEAWGSGKMRFWGLEKISTQ